METLILIYKNSQNLSTAFRTAINMSFISMLAMEISMAGTDYFLTGIDERRRKNKVSMNEEWRMKDQEWRINNDKWKMKNYSY